MAIVDQKAIWLSHSALLYLLQVLDHVYLDAPAHFPGFSRSYSDWSFVLALVHVLGHLNFQYS